MLGQYRYRFKELQFVGTTCKCLMPCRDIIVHESSCFLQYAIKLPSHYFHKSKVFVLKLKYCFSSMKIAKILKNKYLNKPLCKNCGSQKFFYCIFECWVKSCVRKIVNGSCVKKCVYSVILTKQQIVQQYFHKFSHFENRNNLFCRVLPQFLFFS